MSYEWETSTKWIAYKDLDLPKYGYDEFKLITTDQISSSYWYTDKGVYRKSNHWWNVNTCNRELDSNKYKTNSIGFCAWENFYKKITYFTWNDLKPIDPFYKDLPKIPLNLLGEENIAYEFNRFCINNIIELNHPIDEAPNHSSDTIQIIEWLRLTQKDIEILNKDEE
jgi:hypothetical protein